LAIEQKKNIHIAIAFDQNYLTPFEALLSSLLINNATHVCHLHFIATGITDYQKAAIERRIASQSWKATFYEISDQRIEQFTISKSWTKAAYYRLYFPHLIPASTKRIIYLDTDTLVIGDLSELYSINMEGFPVAAVYDNYVQQQPLIGINEQGNYFNSGVLLIDIPMWRGQHISEKAIDYLLQFPDRILFVDQCALNAVLINNWKRLDSRYNLIYTYLPLEISKGELLRFVRDKVVVHFTLQRPWNMLCKNRLRSLYFYYLKKAGSAHRFYTDFSWIKIPAWIKIRLTEMYFDNRSLRWIWKSLKRAL
jgi:lipopolysaccharide biosynthesis glycosyltransferase